MKFINLPYFIVALAIGLFLNYITNPESKVIYVYPTPENVGDLQFKDKADNCYQFKSTKVKCTDKAKPIPIQT